MNRFFVGVWVAALLGPLGAAQGQKAELPEPTEKRVYKEVDGKALEIWIWKPVSWKKEDRRSAVVFYHGGGWKGGSPTAFARSAFRWVKTHAGELGIDAGKIAAGGGSAGGHLAAGLVTLGAFDDEKDDLSVVIDPVALVLFNPAVKLDFERARAGS
jgi:acetyl esterase/lipase